MSVPSQSDKDEQREKISFECTTQSQVTIPRSPSTQSRVGETILNNYIDLVRSKSNIYEDAKQREHAERPFDFFDDEEYSFGVNLLNKNVACVGDNITKLIQMAQEPWPDNVKLFQPYEVEQILLPDNASCLAVQAFLKMCNLPFEVEMRWNAEFMSPSGRVPFIKCGAFVVSELEPVVQFAANKGVTLCNRLSTEEKAEMRAYMSLITNVLVNAELYISWLDDETFNAVTKVRNSSVYPWPLGWLQTRAKRNAVAKRLKALHWQEKTLDQVLADVEQCCNSLSQRLGDRDYFFGTPTPLDALLYGHIRAIMSATGPKVVLMIKAITSELLRHLLRMVNVTGMKLTYQEEYLITQAFQITRSRSPERMVIDRPRTSVNRSKMALKRTKDNMFGFKPFAAKDIVIMTSKEGHVTCQYEGPNKYEGLTLYDEYDFIFDIVDDIVRNVGQTSDESHDFEVVATTLENFVNIDVKEDLDSMVEERLYTDMYMDMPDIETSDVPPDMERDSDGVVTDKLLSVEDLIECVSPELVGCSDIKESEDYFFNTNGDAILDSPSFKSDTRLFDSAESNVTVVMPSGSVSVENILEVYERPNPFNQDILFMADTS